MLKEFQLSRFLWITLVFMASWMLSAYFDHNPGFRKSCWFSLGISVAATLKYGNIYALTALPGFLIPREFEAHWNLPPWAAFAAGCIIALHAFTGAWFIRRFLGNITTLPNSPKGILAFLLLVGGPNGLITAGLGVLVFTTVGIFTWDQALHPFLTWWIGPMGGTFVGAACFLVLLDKEKSVRHKAVVVLPLIAAIISITVIYRSADAYYQADQDYVRLQKISRIKNAFKSELRTLMVITPRAAALVEAMPDISADQFQRIAEAAVKDLPSVMGMVFESRVTDDERPAFEQRMSTQLGRQFKIGDVLNRKEIVEAAKRDEYFPVTHVYLRDGKPVGYGMDISGEPTRRDAILSARDQGSLAITEPTELMFAENHTRNIIAFYPVFDGGNYTTVEDRRAHHRGNISVVVCVSDWIQQTLASIAPDCLVQIRDLDLPANAAPIFDNLPAGAKPLGAAATVPFDYYGQHWQIEVFEATGPGGNLDAQTRQRLLLILQAILLFGTCAFVLMAVGHASATEELYNQGIRHQKLLQARTTAILEAIADGVAKVDDQGRVIWVNSAVTKMTHRSRDKLVGINVIELLAPSNRDAVRQALDLLMSTGELQVLGRDQPLGLITAGDQTLPVQVALTPFTTPEGNNRYVVVLSDVTERIQREQAQIDRGVALRAQENKDQFLTIMGHELRTPLNAIIGYADLLSEEDDLLSSAERRTQTARISHAGHSLLNLVNNIIKVAKADSGASGVKAVDFELRDLCEEIEQAGNMVIRQPDQTLAVRGSTTDVFRTDLSRLQETIMHMVDNAAKFTPRGAIEIEVTQEERSGRPWLEIAVRDVGVGIEPQHLGHIFEPFYQADGSNTRKFEGAGVGLYLCKTYVQSLGGEIEVESQPGKGTVFTVRVPRL